MATAVMVPLPLTVATVLSEDAYCTSFAGALATVKSALSPACRRNAAALACGSPVKQATSFCSA